MYMFSEADVTLFGGAAGSGKSEIGVIDFLKYTDIPNFIGVITRRTTPQLHGPGGILTKCKRIFSQSYSPDEYRWFSKDGKFKFFKSGAEIYLKHFENDEAADNWQGTEANLFLADEGTQFTLFQLQYIMSRMRNPSCPEVRPHLKITCNPDADHPLAKWVEPYLKEDGTPDRSKDGMIRYFSFQDGDFVWGDTKEELTEKYGIAETDSLSFTFISANVYDNKIVQEVNPKYVAWLKGLRGVERARLLEGNWKVREQGSGYFKREWITPVKYHEQEFVSMVRAWDIAGSLPTESNPNPDWTVGTLMGKTKQGRYVVCHVERFRARYGEVMQKIIDTARTDPDGTRILLPKDPAAAGKIAAQEMLKNLLAEGLTATFMTTNQKKVLRFQPFAVAAENGLVDYIEDEWNDTFFYELEAFDGSRGKKDDIVDTISDAFSSLSSKRNLPNVLNGLQSGSFTQPSILSFN